MMKKPVVLSPQIAGDLSKLIRKTSDVNAKGSVIPYTPTVTQWATVKTTGNAVDGLYPGVIQRLNASTRTYEALAEIWIQADNGEELEIGVRGKGERCGQYTDGKNIYTVSAFGFNSDCCETALCCDSGGGGGELVFTDCCPYVLPAQLKVIYTDKVGAATYLPDSQCINNIYSQTPLCAIWNTLEGQGTPEFGVITFPQFECCGNGAEPNPAICNGFYFSLGIRLSTVGYVFGDVTEEYSCSCNPFNFEIDMVFTSADENFPSPSSVHVQVIPDFDECGDQHRDGCKELTYFDGCCVPDGLCVAVSDTSGVFSTMPTDFVISHQEEAEDTRWGKDLTEFTGSGSSAYFLLAFIGEHQSVYIRWAGVNYEIRDEGTISCDPVEGEFTITHIDGNVTFTISQGESCTGDGGGTDPDDECLEPVIFTPCDEWPHCICMTVTDAFGSVGSIPEGEYRLESFGANAWIAYWDGFPGSGNTLVFFYSGGQIHASGSVHAGGSLSGNPSSGNCTDGYVFNLSSGGSSLEFTVTPGDCGTSEPCDGEISPCCSCVTEYLTYTNLLRSGTLSSITAFAINGFQYQPDDDLWLEDYGSGSGMVLECIASVWTLTVYFGGDVFTGTLTENDCDPLYLEFTVTGAGGSMTTQIEPGV